MTGALGSTPCTRQKGAPRSWAQRETGRGSGQEVSLVKTRVAVPGHLPSGAAVSEAGYLTDRVIPDWRVMIPFLGEVKTVTKLLKSGLAGMGLSISDSLWAEKSTWFYSRWCKCESQPHLRWLCGHGQVIGKKMGRLHMLAHDGDKIRQRLC